MTRSATTDASISRNAALGGLLLVLLVAFGLRFTAVRADGGLWYDEIFGASYVNLNPLELVVAVLRFDIHPPLYYLQLNAWSLLSKQDTWLLLNSVFWSLGSIVVVYLGVAARAGRTTALLAAALTALLGSEVYYASDLRMYALLGCNVLLLWYCVDQWLQHGRRGHWLALCVLVLCLSMLHSIAFIAVGSVLYYAVIRSWVAGERHRLKPLLWFVAISGVLLLPWLANASFRSVSHTRMPSVDNVAQTLGGWLLGYFPGSGAAQYAVATALVLALVIYLLVFGSAYVRACVASFVVLPVLVVGGISLVLRPIWLDRTLAYTAPFLAIALAVHLHERLRPEARLRVGGAALVAAMLVFGALYGKGWERLQTPRKMDFHQVARHIAQHNTERRDIYVPANVRYWAMAHYLKGPGWGSLLAIQDPARIDDSDTWRKIYQKLGDTWLERLHLKGSARFIETDHGRLWIGYSPLPDEVVARGYYYVGDNNDRDKSQACPQGRETSRRSFEGVMVFECKNP
jgi:mannosyltransferase